MPVADFVLTVYDVTPHSQHVIAKFGLLCAGRAFRDDVSFAIVEPGEVVQYLTPFCSA